MDVIKIGEYEQSSIIEKFHLDKDGRNYKNYYRKIILTSETEGEIILKRINENNTEITNAYSFTYEFEHGYEHMITVKVIDLDIETFFISKTMKFRKKNRERITELDGRHSHQDPGVQTYKHFAFYQFDFIYKSDAIDLPVKIHPTSSIPNIKFKGRSSSIFYNTASLNAWNLDNNASGTDPFQITKIKLDKLKEMLQTTGLRLYYDYKVSFFGPGSTHSSTSYAMDFIDFDAGDTCTTFYVLFDRMANKDNVDMSTLDKGDDVNDYYDRSDSRDIKTLNIRNDLVFGFFIDGFAKYDDTQVSPVPNQKIVNNLKEEFISKLSKILEELKHPTTYENERTRIVNISKKIKTLGANTKYDIIRSDVSFLNSYNASIQELYRFITPTANSALSGDTRKRWMEVFTESEMEEILRIMQ